MKTATMQFYRAIVTIVMLVVFLGATTAVVAGDARSIVRPRHATQTQVSVRDTGSGTPRPVADEKPINPEQLINSTPGNSNPTSDSNRPPVKRNTVRRR
jgi:hypothetical protein